MRARLWRPTPVAGAIAHEVIGLLVILNATRVGLTRKPMADFRT